jgi:CheY-like chemotaxis protein
MTQTLTSAAKVLIVDDEPDFRDIVGRWLDKVPGLLLSYAADGVEAVEQIERDCPEVILTDLKMPRMNGLELVEFVRKHQVPAAVVLMTAYGSEEIAVEAMQKGAAGYVPKNHLGRDLRRIVRDVVSCARAARKARELRKSLVRSELAFRLENDPDLAPPLVDRLLEDLESLQLRDAESRVQIGIALREALANAMFHGNLEVSSELREQEGNVFYELADERRRQGPYMHRSVEVNALTTGDGAVYVIRDEGPGFCPAAVPDPTEPANLLRASGRGLFLIRTFVDEVAHNETGNQITLRVRRRR